MTTAKVIFVTNFVPFYLYVTRNRRLQWSEKAGNIVLA